MIVIKQWRNDYGNKERTTEACIASFIEKGRSFPGVLRNRPWNQPGPVVKLPSWLQGNAT
ncbi:MAG: hypothetical protein VB063_11205 [Bacteroides graminisolvens]|nr:hypothetical protein [Bacteroides graminisolvens]